MMTMTERILRRFKADAGEGEESPAPGKARVPARWQEFLDKVHQGGKEKVPNPNSATKDRFPQVSFTTALKDKKFYAKAMEEYREWIKEDKAPSGGGETKNKETPKASLSFGVTHEEIKQAAATHKKAFDNILAEAKERLKSFKYTKVRDKSKWAQERFNTLGEAEKLIFVAGHRLGMHFEKNVLTKKQRRVHEKFIINGWREDTSGKEAHEMQGFMKKHGVKGYLAPQDADEAEEARSRGENNSDMDDWAKEMYTFQQAFFEHLGVKEISVFRGVKGQGMDGTPPKEGDPVSIKTRELSSFSMDPDVAHKFGHVIEFKVPVSQIFASSLVAPSIGSDVNKGMLDDDVDFEDEYVPEASWGEAEAIILGASDLRGDLAVKIGSSKLAAKNKPFEVHFDKSNEDWLSSYRKKQKKEQKGQKDKKADPKKASAKVVLRRYLRSQTLV